MLTIKNAFIDAAEAGDLHYVDNKKMHFCAAEAGDLRY